MTLASERIKAAHRGFSRAEPASRSRIAALDSFGLRYTRVDDFNCLVEDRYQLNLAMSFWRAIDGSSQGYLVSALYVELEKQNPKKPAAVSTNISTPELTKRETNAETAAGPSLSSNDILTNSWP